MNEALEALLADLRRLPRVTGVLTIALGVTPDGSVEFIDFLADTLMPRALPDNIAADDLRADIRDCVIENLSKLRFPEAADSSRVCVPLIFE